MGFFVSKFNIDMNVINGVGQTGKNFVSLKLKLSDASVFMKLLSEGSGKESINH